MRCLLFRLNSRSNWRNRRFFGYGFNWIVSNKIKRKIELQSRKRRSSKMDKKKKHSKRRAAAQFQSPASRKRQEQRTTPDLPGMEEFSQQLKPETPRSDNCWRHAEATVKHVLLLGGYSVSEQVNFGRAYGSDLIADFICYLPWRPEDKILISCKWLRAGGSWDRKIPDDVATWDRNIPFNGVQRGYVVILGPGLSVKKKLRWCDNIELDTPRIEVIDFDLFAARAWCWEL